MLMMAEILGGWTLLNDDGPELHPSVSVDYGIKDFKDITFQPEVPTVPNLFSLLVKVDSAVLDVIRTDPKYFILWEEPA